jgi:hypothetical protein
MDWWTLWTMPAVLRTEVPPFCKCCSSSSGVSTAWSLHHISLMSPNKLLKRIQVWRTTWTGYWSLPSFRRQCRQSQNNFWRCSWNALRYRHAWQITLAKCTPKTDGKNRHWVYKAPCMSL